MSIEEPVNDLDLHKENLERLEVLMGADYDGMEMQDYMSYVRPEDAKMEIDGLEERLNSGRQERSQILKEFKAHLSYVYAAK